MYIHSIFSILKAIAVLKLFKKCRIWSNIMRHNHNHEHGHSHSHDHKYEQSNDYNHNHNNSTELTLEQKLQTLLGHWVDHNESHKDTFFTWAKRAKDQGIDNVALNLEKAGQLSMEVTDLLKDALKKFKE